MSKESVLITALEKIIEMNRQNAEDQYGNADKAERWSCVTVAREAIKKYNTETKEPSIKEEPKDHIPDIGKMIGEDELVNKFAGFLGRHDRVISEISRSDLAFKHSKELVEIAQQYANSKLEELEKKIDSHINWCEENIELNTIRDAPIQTELNTIPYKSFIRLLKSLKQQ